MNKSGDRWQGCPGLLKNKALNTSSFLTTIATGDSTQGNSCYRLSTMTGSRFLFRLEMSTPPDYDRTQMTDGYPLQTNGHLLRINNHLRETYALLLWSNDCLRQTNGIPPPALGQPPPD
ncbi:hypothetical protein JTE90_001448 [Oedothorax gibbosus]|uniref:Uncharacterized protein n=1 Tax=Oedothorax gibbosus TaxID=931172 RepID=A0AAV6TUD6_9ARAC|nr:hypothetical protein JTE90_001448 [Oedothorax gibbosus]